MLTIVFLDTCFLIVVRQVVMYCAELLFKKFWSKTSQKRRALKKKLTYIMPDYYWTESTAKVKVLNGRNRMLYFFRTASNGSATVVSMESRFWHPLHVLLMACLSMSYLCLSCLLIGFKVDQLLLIAFINVNYFACEPTRRFITAYSVFVVYWIMFDYMKAFPNYTYADVHISNLYETEKRLFGLNADNDTVVTPNEYWSAHGSQLLDIIAGFFYLCWIPVPLLFAIWLLYGHSVKQYLNFSLTFLLVNVIGFTIYYAYPAAPPWYVQTNGFEFVATTPGSASRLANFDAYFGVDLFKAIYAKSSNVFAALPSLHSAYPIVVLYYGLKTRLPCSVNAVFAIIMFGIWFSAVYSGQHYVLDVFAGILCACIGILAYNRLLLIKAIHQLIHKHFYRLINHSFHCYTHIRANYDDDCDDGDVEAREKFQVIVCANDGHTQTI